MAHQHMKRFPNFNIYRRNHTNTTILQTGSQETKNICHIQQSIRVLDWGRYYEGHQCCCKICLI